MPRIQRRHIAAVANNALWRHVATEELATPDNQLCNQQQPQVTATADRGTNIYRFLSVSVILFNKKLATVHI